MLEIDYERKKMSKTFKRIALVASAALAIGSVSTVSANAAITYAAATPFSVAVADSGVTADGTTVGTTLAAGQVAGSANYVRIKAGVDIAASSTLRVTTSGADSWVAGDNTGTSATLTDNSSTGVKATVITTATNDIFTDASNYVGIKVYTPTVGTVTVTIAKSVDNGTGSFTVTTLQTLTITVSAASVVGIVSAANSTSYITDSATVVAYTSNADVAGASLSADATVLAAKGTDAVAMIQVRIKDTQSPTPAAVAAKSLSATVTGSGLITGTSTGTTTLGTSPARVATSTTDSSGYAAFKVYGDNTSGTGSITITYTDAAGVTITIATETWTFYSTTVASVTATQVLKVGSIAGARLGANTEYLGTSATKPAFVVALKDANGNLVAGGCSNVKVTSSDTLVYSSTVAGVTPETAAAGAYGLGYCDVDITSIASTSGKSATITAYVLAADGVTKISAAPLTFTVGGTTAYAATITPDADSYAPGAKVTLTATLTDKYGNPVADGTYNLFADPTTGTDAVAVLSPSASITTNPFASTTGNVTTVGGVATSSFYAPYASGAVTLSGTTGETGLAAALQGTTITASVNVANPTDATAQAAIDAAQEATDAANAAYDAANNAMDSADAATAAAQEASDNAAAALAAVTELATTVANLVAKVNSIAATLAKIAKKVKA